VAALDFALFRGQSPQKDFGVCCHDPVASLGSQFAQGSPMP
jgi:hypothetical protein